MHLADLPLILMLVGLVAYAVLGGADFGAGFWQLAGGHGPRADPERDRAIREHAHHAMGPVWEANHVWLIYVLVVAWTAFPTAFGSITSTLAAPLFIAGVGIILRGTAYALRSGTATARENRRVELLFSGASILTPFALGTVVGGIASGRVPVGNASGDLVSSWLNETSILVGIMFVVTAAHLAAVYLAADAARLGEPELVAAFRTRALVTGVCSGAVALAGLVVVRDDARPLWDGLTSGWGVAAVVVSGLAGLTTLALVWRSRFELARASGTVSVAAVVAGWALAQRPDVLPGLPIQQAAAGRSTLIWLLVSIAVGAVLLVPSLALLFGLVLRGRFDAEELTPPPSASHGSLGTFGRLGAVAAVCLVVGGVSLFFFESRWAHLVGVLGLLGFVGAGFVALAALVVETADDRG
jgi:cytochrome d ubiquinol oxidase subunit II